MAQHLYDPLAPDWFDAGATRAERDRTFHICSDCRVCVKLCPSFKSLFRMIDDAGGSDHAGELTDAQHKRVIDECYQCKLCYVICPYTPDQHQEWRIDFPQLMLRSLTNNARLGDASRSARLLARTDQQGAVATTLAPVVNATARLKPARLVMEKVTGIARDRVLPSFDRVRFSKWFRGRRAQAAAAPRRRGPVALFPTCLVEYQQPAIGRAAVGVLERNGFECELPEGQVCCGMPWLDAGDAERFRQAAQRNVEALLPAVERGLPVIVPQPTCAYTLKDEYPAFLGTEAARKVSAATYDAAEFLMAKHREETLDTDFDGQTYETIVWHAACHYRAQQIGPRSSQLMQLTGAKVQVVERCSAIDGTWGLRAENVELARRVAKPLMDKIRESGAALVAGDCQLANVAIGEGTGRHPIHPLQVLARAYGVPDT
ncbi:MAG TPA: heterodisulfide reductase-related iron-sulfur binding cluster [Acidimicrobiia bacterium]|nr:heterodisulfide reductase-related iron-sulfur binding cluster [Acidimicrobiia bacterium]